MALVISEQQVRAVNALPWAKRYEYFLKRVVDTSRAWAGTVDGQLFECAASSGTKGVALWPTIEFVRASDFASIDAGAAMTTKSIREYAAATPDGPVFPFPLAADGEHPITWAQLLADMHRLRKEWY